MTIQDIGETVRALRKERGMTQAELASLAGVGRRFVSDLENGKTTLRVGETEQVLRVFGLTLVGGPRPRGAS